LPAFNCAVVFYRGQILGVAVKTYLPNYREFYEARQFTPASNAFSSQIELAGQENIPFGADIIFKVSNINNFSFSWKFVKTFGCQFLRRASQPWPEPL